ncbi:putative Rmd1/YagE family protein [Constrictibacter sp. MBR-5]|jgi:uncharacterized Rmd1/YagE family protein|uniref:RMD1 family protein n=1 Tax=Constrictibacter sp. MBR-5 TaxID=3156467 RepID=UPI0033995F90
MNVWAVLLSERLDTRRLEGATALATLPLTVRAGASGHAVLFRYGVAVLFDLDAEEQQDFLAGLAAVAGGPVEKAMPEEATIVVDPAADETVLASGAIRIQAVTVERMQVIADVLAKSLVLDYYEKSLARTFDRIDPVAEELKRSGRNRSRPVDLLKHIGDVLIAQHRTVGRVEVTEKPEVLWEFPALERLYLRLEDEYELRERDIALRRKLDVISGTVEALLDLVHHKHSLRVEWYIVILIIFEIGLTLYELFHA